MVSAKVILIIICVITLSVTPVLSVKNKGLFSGDVLDVVIGEYTADVPDTPTYLPENQEAVQVNPQDTGAWIKIGKSQL